MAIFAGDLRLYLTGGASKAVPAASLGGVISSVQFTDNTLDKLFASVGPADALAGATHYRALTFKNTSAQTAYGAAMHISQETSSADTTVAVAYDSTGTQSIVDEDTPPIGLSFSTPLSLATAIALGDIVTNGTARVWFKRIVSAGASAASADTGKITFTVGSAT